jgi:hypothetical protein
MANVVIIKIVKSNQHIKLLHSPNYAQVETQLSLFTQSMWCLSVVFSLLWKVDSVLLIYVFALVLWKKKKNTLCQAANNHISFLFPSLISHECYTFEDTVITVCAPTLRIVPRRLVFVAKSASTTSQVPNRSTGQIMQHKLEPGLSIFVTKYVQYSLEFNC